MLVRAVRVGIPITGGMRSVASRQSRSDRTGVSPGRRSAHCRRDAGAGAACAGRAKSVARIWLLRHRSRAAERDRWHGQRYAGTIGRVIRKRVALREHARALASEARTSIYILAALPVFAGGALAVINPDYLYTLFVDPQGRTVFATAVGMLTTGIVTMRTIVTPEPVMNRQVLLLMVLAFAMFVHRRHCPQSPVASRRDVGGAGARRAALGRHRGRDRADRCISVGASVAGCRRGRGDHPRGPAVGKHIGRAASAARARLDSGDGTRWPRSSVPSCWPSPDCRCCAGSWSDEPDGRLRFASRRLPVRVSSACCCPTTWCERCTSAT